MDDTYNVQINRERDKVKWGKETFPHLIGTDEFEARVRKAIKSMRKREYELQGREWSDENQEFNEEIIDPYGHGLRWRLTHEYNDYGGSYGESYSGSQPYGGQDPFFQ